MLWILGLLCVIQKHVCMHDYYERQDLRSQQPENLRRKTLEETEITRTGLNQMLRIHFNTDQFKGDQKENLDKMFDDIKSFLSFLNIDTSEVQNSTSLASLKSHSVCSGKCNSVPSNLPEDVDLYILVKPEPLKGSTLAQAAAIDDCRTQSKRPYAGYIKINSNRNITVQYLNSSHRDLITTILHELQHVLSFSSSNFEKWIGYDQDKVRKSIVNEKYNITQTFLITPRLKEWVHSRFFVHSSKYDDFGLELEDDGGEGTVNSHPNARLYFTDLMQGVTYGPAYISPIFFLSLLDSGWYTIPDENLMNSRMELLPYLDLTLVQTTEIQNEKLLDNPAYIAYPPSYLCKSGATTCFPGNLYKAVCDLISVKDFYKVNADDRPIVQERNHSWYYPSETSLVINESTLDLAPTYSPYRPCNEEPADGKDIGEEYSDSSICVMSLSASITESISYSPKCMKAECLSDNKLAIIYKDKRYTCQNDGDKLSIPGYPGYIICPPARSVCTIKTNKREPTILVNEIIPDRGTYQGKNIIQFNGQGYKQYSNLTIAVGGVDCKPVHMNDKMILCKLGEGKDSLKGQTVDIVLKNNDITTTLEKSYIFLNTKYDGK